MSLNTKQFQFSFALSQLISYIYTCGYTCSMGDVWAKQGHSTNSYHYKRLAADLNLFKDGKYLSKTSDHEKFGEYWEVLGGTWGGRFKHKDGNHYSWGE